jgi:hypothetical protein
LLSFTVQSPRPPKSLSRVPNQPSSMTNSSMPRGAAAAAMLTSFSASKPNSVASQLLMSTGRRFPSRGS